MLTNSQEIIGGIIIHAPLGDEVQIMKQYRRGEVNFQRKETYVIYNNGEMSEVRGGFAFSVTPQVEKRIRTAMKQFRVSEGPSILDHRLRLTIAGEDSNLPTLLCPVCGCGETHIESAYSRLGEDERAYRGTEAEVSPPTHWRRSGLAVRFWCEVGHRFEILLQHHKGRTYVLTSRLENSRQWSVDEESEKEDKAAYDQWYAYNYERDFAKDHADWLSDHADFSDGVYRISP